MKKLSTKIFIVIFMGTLTAALAVGICAFVLTRDAMRKPIMDNQLVLAKQTMNKIDRMLYERMLDIQQIASEDALETYIVGLGEAQNPLMQKELNRRMDELNVVTGPWDVLFILDKEGHILLWAGDKLLGDSIEAYSNKYIAYKASLNGKTYYSDLVVSGDTGRPTVIFSTPIRALKIPGKPIVGAVVGNFSWPAALEILNGVSAHAMLLNQKGQMIGNSHAIAHPELIMNALKSEAVSSKLNKEKSQSAIISAGGVFSKVTLASIAVQPGYLSYRGSAWKLVLETPAETAFASATHTTLKLVLFLLLILLIAAAVLLGMIQKLVVRPIQHLTETIREITKGDLTKKAQVKSSDEIGQLAVSFNAMTGELKASYENLEDKVEQRTDELSKANEELTTEIKGRQRLEKVILQSEKMAAVGQLAGGVAHEINNPLGVILGFAQSIVKRLEPGNPLEMPLKSIEREAIRCKNLVQSLLTFSRVNRIDKEEMDLNEEIESSLSIVLAQAKVRNVSLVKDLDSTLPRIFANKNQIQQVVVNLSNNAIDAMPAGGTFTICTKRSQLNGKDAIEIRAQDTGSGISKEIQAKIFEPFFTTKEVGKGTGLGLSLVYEIVQKHGGQIRVESEVGKGAVFTLYLPLEAFA